MRSKSSAKFLRRVARVGFFKKWTIYICAAIVLQFLIMLLISKLGYTVPLVLVYEMAFSLVLLMPALIINYFCSVPKFDRILNLLKENGISVEEVASELENAVFVDKKQRYGYTDRFLVIKKSTVVPFKELVSIKCMTGLFETNFKIKTTNSEILIGMPHGAAGSNDWKLLYKVVHLNNHKLSAPIDFTREKIEYPN